MSEITVIRPSVYVHNENRDPIEKVAEMARICYRSEKNASPENDAKLIAGCIKRGHESVLEHGFMSVYFGNTPINMKSMRIPQFPNGYTSSQLWASFSSPDIRKYSEVYGDDQIYKIIDGSNATAIVYPTVVANFRAWRNILDACLVASIRDGFAIGVAMICGIIVKANDLFPEIFSELKDRVNEAFSHAGPDNFLYKTFVPETATNKVLTIDRLSRFYNVMEIYCAPAPARYSLSAVLRTDRSVTHQLVRHRRDVAYSQESQRYVNYQNKGYEVVWPQMDPIKYKDAEFKTVPIIKEGETEATVDTLPILESGFIPPTSSAYNTWHNAMELAISHYEALRMTTIGEIKSSDGTGDSSEVHLPPEIARTVLPNSFATTIGVTWTPATFVNLVKWRLEEHAQWPIRFLIGSIIVHGLRSHHAFFDNFPPDLVVSWIGKCNTYKIIDSPALYKSLMHDQEKRAANIEKAKKELAAKIAAQNKQREEAFKKLVADKQKAHEEAAKKEGVTTPSAPTPTDDSTKQ